MKKKKTVTLCDIRVATLENFSSSHVTGRSETTCYLSTTPYIELTHFNSRKCVPKSAGLKKNIQWKLHNEYFDLMDTRIPTGFTFCGFQPKFSEKLSTSLFFFGGQYLPDTNSIDSFTKHYDSMLCGPPLIGSDKVLEVKLYPNLDIRHVGRLHYRRVHAACLPLPGGDRIAIIGGDRTGKSIEFFNSKTRTSTVGPILNESRHHMGVVAITDDTETDLLVLGGLSGPFQGTALRTGEIVCQKMLHEQAVLRTARCHVKIEESLNTTKRDAFTRPMSFQSLYTFRDYSFPNTVNDKPLSSWTAQKKENQCYENKLIAPMIQARAKFSILRIASTPWILVAGGYNGVKPLQTTELYHLASNIWIPGPLLNYSRMNSLIWQDRNMNIYLAGGVEGYDHKPLLAVEKWNASILKSQKNLLKKSIGRFRILKNVTGPKTNYSSTIVYKTKPCQLNYSLTTLLKNTFDIPKLSIKNHLSDLCYQDSMCSTSLGPQNSFGSTCDDTYDKQIRDETDFLQAPRRSLNTYFKSPLVTKMKQRNSLKTIL